MKRIRNEHGIALAVAIVALVVVGALVAGAFFVGMQEQRVGRNTLSSQQAFSAAQEGGQLIVANWSSGSYRNLDAGGSEEFSGDLMDGTGWYRGRVRRLNDLLFLVQTEGFSRDSVTRQTVGLLVRLRPIEIDVSSALKTRGATKVRGNSEVNGNDTPPDGWDCDATEDPLPGIQVDDASLVDIQCSEPNCVTGDPPVEEDPTITEESLTTFGDLTFADLKAMATKVLAAGTYTNMGPSTDPGDGSCNTSDPKNFGDPLNPAAACGGYFPITYFEGTGLTKLSTGMGQGILIVEGDLSLAGNFQFFGPIVVRGKISTTGTGNKMTGGVIAANSAELVEDETLVAGDATIRYSSCAVRQSLQQSAPGGLLNERSWVSLYN